LDFMPGNLGGGGKRKESKTQDLAGRRDMRGDWGLVERFRGKPEKINRSKSVGNSRPLILKDIL